jgi:hypothetical protein
MPLCGSESRGPRIWLRRVAGFHWYLFPRAVPQSFPTMISGKGPQGGTPLAAAFDHNNFPVMKFFITVLVHMLRRYANSVLRLSFRRTSRTHGPWKDDHLPRGRIVPLLTS